ncbi:Mitochondrial carrier protein [Quillaja saponaria]|uniref:Mitochondrial carrier protein n=1 Tax=Quillaja saponaria TaxID=32244 RepID=A0AAD7L703_QUISA|nr:Mitochondrial carrier protein [Quillaja saponaria]
MKVLQPFTENAMVFQIYSVLSRAFDSSATTNEPLSYKGVVLGGVSTGALQSLMLSPVELVKIRLQLQNKVQSAESHRGPLGVAKSIFRTEGFRGMYRGFAITMLRDAPSHGIYFWTYEYMREQLHPGCRKSGQETMRTVMVAGGLAGAASWVCCYPLDVVKTRLQAQTPSPLKYSGIVDCLRKSINEDGYRVLWRGLGTAVARAFLVNGAIFSAYEISLRVLFDNVSIQAVETV